MADRQTSRTLAQPAWQRRLTRWAQRSAALLPIARRERRPAQAAGYAPALTFAIFGVVLGLLLGTILAIPLSAGAGIVKGAPSPVRINAPREITFESEVLTRQAQERAASNPANVRYDLNTAVVGQQREALERTLEAISAIHRDSTLSRQDRISALLAQPTLPLSSTLALQILELNDNQWQQVADASRQLYDQIWQNAGGTLTEAELRQLRERELPYLRLAPTLNDTQRALVLSLVDAFLRPNLLVDQQATEAQREAARQSVKPVTVTVRKGENIVREGDIVTDEIYEKLSKLGLVFGAGGSLAILQQMLLGMLAAWLFATYLYRYQRGLWRNRRGLAVIGLLMAVMLLAGRIAVPAWQDVPYVFPLAALGVLITVLFDGRIGLLAVLTLAPLIGMQSEESIGLALTLALGGAAGVFAAHRATRSFTFVWVGLAITLITAAAAVVFWLDPLGGAPVWQIPLYSALNGAQSSVLALGTYQILGRLANVVTPLQLMELAHPNQPLLHRLMREAPGTYHHSMVVSSLAEVAAEDIGADPLLARVGAYYHDIGKILRPYFFTDNQHERANVHDQLDAKTSARIIIDHVTEGEKLARQHHLPQQVIDFIRQHHGTSLVSFFYQRALQEDENVNIEDFRYPGPKPQTREAGILMLADGIEATVRSRAQSGKLRPIRPDAEAPTGGNGAATQSIADVVEQIFNERLRSGQLDECPLTLRDIAIIKQSFIKTLQGIYHPRVDYPS
ncbi:HD family phosphohydrolase [Kallotenue papyrolyticum]|uniref:HD family phosphohydrolase n=1 Tax=Kallotenue papyrolyticum TaxID=1325125 RepID=UPI0004B1319E|nr:HDIG domain-containing metalloprotein [Kallotenue papyrolyticum]